MNEQMSLGKGIPVKVGKIEGFVFGGRYMNFIPGTRRLIGVKMAEEIDHPHDISIPTEDFSVPDVQAMQSGIIGALFAMNDGNDVYAGCMGGIGRTGLFMGCMAKVINDYAIRTGDELVVPLDPVDFVRQHYMSHAIETTQQQAFVRNFPTNIIMDWLDRIQEIPVREVEKEVVRYPSWLEFLRYKLGF